MLLIAEKYLIQFFSSESQQEVLRIVSTTGTGYTIITCIFDKKDELTGLGQRLEWTKVRMKKKSNLCPFVFFLKISMNLNVNMSVYMTVCLSESLSVCPSVFPFHFVC